MTCKLPSSMAFLVVPPEHLKFLSSCILYKWTVSPRARSPRFLGDNFVGGVERFHQGRFSLSAREDAENRCLAHSVAAGPGRS